MNTINKITSWGDSHHFAWMDFFRVVLGIFFIYKGIEFGHDPYEIQALVNTSNSNLFGFFYVQIIPMIHIAGGLMITLGILTRWASAFQIPIVIGAIILSLEKNQSMEMLPQIGVSLIVLVLLITFLILGSGPFSVENFFRKNEDKE
jgi:putative oxidoreductase